MALKEAKRFCNELTKSVKKAYFRKVTATGAYPGTFEGRAGFLKLGHKALTVLNVKVKCRP